MLMFGVQGLGFGAYALGLRVWRLGLRGSTRLFHTLYCHCVRFVREQ